MLYERGAMTNLTTLCIVSDLHGEEKKFSQLGGISQGCSAVITCGDDFDRELKGNYESNALISALLKKHQQKSRISPTTSSALEALLHEIEPLPEEEQKRRLDDFNTQHPEVAAESERIGNAIKTGFAEYFGNNARALNQHYAGLGIPVFGTAGNHDPIPALEEMSAVKYLFGEAVNFKGLSIGGLPATGEWVPGPMRFCREFFPHLEHYSPVADENQEGEISGLAKKLLEKPIDIFVTHKAYRKDLQHWDKYYAKDDQFGVDAGAVAVAKRSRPKLNVFGHYHMERPKVAERDGTFHVYVGPNAAVKVTLDGNRPVKFDSVFY